MFNVVENSLYMSSVEAVDLKQVYIVSVFI